MAPFDGKYMTSNLMAIVIFALSLTIYEIFENQIKRKKFNLDNEEQGRGENGTCATRLEMFKFICDFSEF